MIDISKAFTDKFYYRVTKEGQVMFLMLTIFERNRYLDRGYQIKKIW